MSRFPLTVDSGASDFMSHEEAIDYLGRGLGPFTAEEEIQIAEQTREACADIDALIEMYLEHRRSCA